MEKAFSRFSLSVLMIIDLFLMLYLINPTFVINALGTGRVPAILQAGQSTSSIPGGAGSGGGQSTIVQCNYNGQYWNPATKSCQCVPPSYLNSQLNPPQCVYPQTSTSSSSTTSYVTVVPSGGSSSQATTVQGSLSLSTSTIPSPTTRFTTSIGCIGCNITNQTTTLNTTSSTSSTSSISTITTTVPQTIFSNIQDLINDVFVFIKAILTNY